MANNVATQVRKAVDIFLTHDLDRIPRLIEKDGYVDQLNAMVDQRTFQELSKKRTEPFVTRYYRGVFRISINLEKIGDYAANIARQTQHLVGRVDPQMAARFRDMAAKVEYGVRVSVDAFLQGDWEIASDVAEVEQYLDVQYGRCFREIERLFGEEKITVHDVITTIFVAKYLEKAGDSLQNIAEVGISMAAGEQLKVHQVRHLDDVSDGTKWAFRRADGGISGAFTGIVEEPDGTRYFYKEGSFKVIQEEIARSKMWNDLYPGIVPQIHRGIFDENSEGYLMDYLEGRLFQDLYLDPDFSVKEDATQRLLATVEEIWERSMRGDRPNLDVVNQIRRRTTDLFATHPHLAEIRAEPVVVGTIRGRSLEEMLDLAQTLQPRHVPPFSVFSHGDFNTNNVFWEAGAGRIRFIDVHRSGPSDFARDLATFVVSNLRQPVSGKMMRDHLYRINRMVVDFGRGFAEKHGDAHFEKRFQLLLARNYITSGRLFVDAAHAKDLFLRGIHCLERYVQ